MDRVLVYVYSWRIQISTLRFIYNIYIIYIINYVCWSFSKVKNLVKNLVKKSVKKSPLLLVLPLWTLSENSMEFFIASGQESTRLGLMLECQSHTDLYSTFNQLAPHLIEEQQKELHSSINDTIVSLGQFMGHYTTCQLYINSDPAITLQASNLQLFKEVFLQNGQLDAFRRGLTLISEGGYHFQTSEILYKGDYPPLDDLLKTWSGAGMTVGEMSQLRWVNYESLDFNGDHFWIMNEFLDLGSKSFEAEMNIDRTIRLIRDFNPDLPGVNIQEFMLGSESIINQQGTLKEQLKILSDLCNSVND